MYRNILVASDLTEASAPAVRAAVELARRLGGSLTALHVTELPYAERHWFTPHLGQEETWLRELSAREQEAARQKLDDQIAAQSGSRDTSGVKVLVRSGAPAEEILAAAEEIGADLIVTGTHGRTGVEHMILGSIAEKVLRSARVPVLTVRGR